MNRKYLGQLCVLRSLQCRLRTFRMISGVVYWAKKKTLYGGHFFRLLSITSNYNVCRIVTKLGTDFLCQKKNCPYCANFIHNGSVILLRRVNKFLYLPHLLFDLHEIWYQTSAHNAVESLGVSWKAAQRKARSFLYRQKWKYIFVHTVKCYIKTKSVQTQLRSIYHTGQHVSTCFRSSSGSQLLFLKHTEKWIHNLYSFLKMFYKYWGLSGRIRSNPLGFEPQPVASPYTDCIISTPKRLLLRQ